MFAGSTRAIRREQRENIYLEIDERERLFGGLLYTPTPNVATNRSMRQAGGAAVGKIVGLVGQVASRSGKHAGRTVGRRVARQSTGRGRHTRHRVVPRRLRDRSLFLAGHFYDRIVNNPAWRSDHFELQRTQVNLHAELAEILRRDRVAGGADRPRPRQAAAASTRSSRSRSTSARKHCGRCGVN